MATEICGFQRDKAITVLVFYSLEFEPDEKTVSSARIVDEP
jgi:hypothetical protein